MTTRNQRPDALPDTYFDKKRPRKYFENGENKTHHMTDAEFTAAQDCVRAFDQTEYSAYTKCRACNRLGVDVVPGIQHEYEVALPYSENFAKAWNKTTEGKRNEYPNFFLHKCIDDSGSYKKIVFDKVGLAYKAARGSDRRKPESRGGAPRPNCLNFNSCRQEYWSPFNQYCVAFWIDNDHLTREQAYNAACQKAEKEIFCHKDVKRLLKQEIGGAQEAVVESNVINLNNIQEVLKRVGDGRVYEFIDEEAGLKVLHTFLKKHQHNYKKKTEPFMVLHYFCLWLDHKRSKKENVSKYEFVENIRLGEWRQSQYDKAIQDKTTGGSVSEGRPRRKCRDANQNQPNGNANNTGKGKSKGKKRKKSPQQTEEAKQAKKTQEALNHKAMMERDKPKLIQAANEHGNPVYTNPKPKWTANMRNIYTNIAAFVDHIADDYGLVPPSYNYQNPHNEYVTPVMKLLGEHVFLMEEQDMQSEAVYKAHLKTWLPEPWFLGFRSYVCAFGEMLSKDGTGGKGADAIKAIVVDYMKTFKPKKEKEAFQKLIDDLTDGVFAADDDDDDEQGEGEQGDNGKDAANSLLLLGAAAEAVTAQDEQAEDEKVEEEEQGSQSSQEHEFQE